jgi:hypothetical protein
MVRSPSLSTIKALFAKSSNRCAFPKCTVNVVQDGMLLGHVCHIKGAKPGSARYDAIQIDDERHSDSNLIILCPNHHSVIDDDAESYTVERLRRMKAEHEAHAAPLDSTTTGAAAAILASAIVSPTGQTGGITSGTFHVGTLNISNEPSSPITTEREVQSVEKLWSIIQKLKKVHGDIWLVESVLTSDEIGGYFRTCDWPATLRSVMHYSSLDWGMQQLTSAGADNSDDCRLYVSDRLWGIYATIRALYGRLGFLYHLSFKKSEYTDWRKDKGFATHAKALLGEALYEQAKATPMHGLEVILGRAEAEFLREARAARLATT